MAQLIRAAVAYARSEGGSVLEAYPVEPGSPPATASWGTSRLSKKWAILGKCSAASTQRDIADLVEKGILRRNQGSSKNTSYAIADAHQGIVETPSTASFPG